MVNVTRDWYDSYLMPNYSPASMIPVRGVGSKIWDQSGREYIDFGGGIAVNVLGHAHPRLVSALSSQATKLWHTANVLTTEPALELAKKLTDLTFADKVFFSNSGAEANEAALKLARRYACDNYGDEKIKIISFDNSFHGRTFFTVSVGGTKDYRTGFGPNPAGIEHLPFNDTLALEKAFTDEVCCVIMEPVQGEGGVVAAKDEFIKKARDLCDQYNALLIMDEVQTGVGRTGKFYAHEVFDIVPDILTTAKALGGGFPIAATLTKSHIAKSFKVGTHGSTWGGNPLGCSVANEVLDIINNPALLDEVYIKRERICNGLEKIGRRYQVFSEIRGMGLLIGCALSEKWHNKAREIMIAAQDKGIFILVAGSNVLRIAPSLIISDEDIDQGLSSLKIAIAEMA